MAAWTIAVMSSSEYHVLASHCVSDEWFTFGPSSARAEGSAVAENAALLAAWLPGMEQRRFVYILRSDVDPNRHYVGVLAIRQLFDAAELVREMAASDPYSVADSFIANLGKHSQTGRALRDALERF